MLKRCRRLVGVLVAIMCCFSITFIASAEERSGKEPEITISTDKTDYADGESIRETVTVKNTVGEELKNLTLSVDIPTGYTTEDGKIVVDKWVYAIERLNVGESKEVTVTFVPENRGQVIGGSDTAAADADGAKEKNTPKTGDAAPIVLVGAVALAAIGLELALVKSRKGKNDKNGRKVMAVLLAGTMAGSLCQLGNSSTVYAKDNNDLVEKAVSSEKEITVGGKKVQLGASLRYYVQEQKTLSYDGYELKWQDEFNGTSLNRDDWNVELHAPGWVNSELQQYVDSEDNIYLQDGHLVIKPIKTENADGSVSYTSGRLNTQGKHDFTYGLFEARVKVPEGKGYLPAFWLMASDENTYGQWPRCGEIDAMEVHGSDTAKTYGTIHYGNPHREDQGTYTLDQGTFSDGYHTFAVEWKPGCINWYVDGILYHTANDWYSATEGQGEITYPAPFDQPFYMILNLAVGGSWVGYPDETTDFENQTYEVDYVRVYQQDSYDENVAKPEKEPVVMRDPDANGNYIINGDFAVEEDLTDGKDWTFLTAAGGKGTARMRNGEIYIQTTDSGDENHSIQLVQPNIPLKKGGTYTVSFDAYADEARTMIVDVSAPDLSYIRYMADTKVELSTTKQTYTYTFDMTKEDDPNGRLEFNMGKNASTAGIHISNVSVKMTNYVDPAANNNKTVLADGNYVYNGAFQEGAGRKEYWEISNQANAEISVTDLADGRRLKLVIPTGTTAANPVVVAQSGLAMQDGESCVLTYDIQGTAGTSVDVVVAGQAAYTVPLTGAKQTGNAKKFTAGVGAEKNLKFLFTQPGTYYLDNVRITEDSLIKNGSFNAGMAGYEPYVDGSASATYVVDSLTEDNAIDFTIDDTGDQAWKIQLKQNDVELEEGQWYRLSLDAKSDITRKLMFAIQRDGTVDNDWTPYSGEKIVDLENGYQTYTIEFQMKKPTDLHSVLSISMGAVGGTQITTQHRICIDNIRLEKIDAPVTPAQPGGAELLKDTSFTDPSANWISNKNATTGVSYTNGVAIWTVAGIAGGNDYDVQMMQKGIQLEKGSTYELAFTAESTASRAIKWDIMSTSYDWYGGERVDLEANVPKAVTGQFTMAKDTDIDSLLAISMGQLKDGEQLLAAPDSTIRISGISLKKVDSTPSAGENLLTNGDFTDGGTGWGAYVHTENGTAAANYSFSNGKATYEITNAGTENWHVQLKQEGITLEAGKTYTLTFYATSDVTRSISVSCMDSSNTNWYVSGDNNVTLVAGVQTPVTMTLTTGDKPTDTNAYVQVSMGGPDMPASTITLSDFVLKKN